MMTPEQRYFFDLTGYLHLPGVLQGEQLRKIQEAGDRYITMDPKNWPAGFTADLERKDLTGYQNGFAFDDCLQALTLHPATWPIIDELTDSRPRFTSGTLAHNRHGHMFHPLHAGATPAHRPDTRRWYIDDGKLRHTDFICFFYLTDVHPGDGGLVILPGSHKAEFDKPADMFYEDEYYQEGYVAEGVPPGVLNITPRAGDVVVVSEWVIHGALPWKPQDRDRRFLILRYNVQHMVTGSLAPFAPEIRQRLSPETLELIEVAPYNHEKELVRARQEEGWKHRVDG